MEQTELTQLEPICRERIIIGGSISGKSTDITKEQADICAEIINEYHQLLVGRVQTLGVHLFSPDELLWAHWFEVVLAIDFVPFNSLVDQVQIIQVKHPNVIPLRLAIDNVSRTLIDRRVDFVNISGVAANAVDTNQILYAIEQWKKVTKLMAVPTAAVGTPDAFDNIVGITRVFTGKHILGYSCG